MYNYTSNYMYRNQAFPLDTAPSLFSATAENRDGGFGVFQFRPIQG